MDFGATTFYLDDDDLLAKAKQAIQTKAPFAVIVSASDTRIGAVKRSISTLVHGESHVRTMLRGALDAFRVGDLMVILSIAIAEKEYRISTHEINGQVSINFVPTAKQLG